MLKDNKNADFIGAGNVCYNKLNSLKCDILILTLPSLEVLFIKKTKHVKKYIHITHSLTPMSYRAFGVDYFDCVLVANNLQANFVRDIECARNLPKKRVEIIGSPYLDSLNKIKSQIPSKKESKTILIAPSWGQNSLLFKFGLKLLLPLAKSDFNLIIRPHPQSLIGKEESQNIADLKENLAQYSNVSWDIGTPNIYAFAACDLLIGDFSSAIFDFVCLFNKPIFILDSHFDSAGYDFSWFEKKDIWTFSALEKIASKITLNDCQNIAQLAHEAIQNPKNNFWAKNLLWMHENEAGFRAFRAILEIYLEILQKDLEQFQPQIELFNEINFILDSKKGGTNA